MNGTIEVAEVAAGEGSNNLQVVLKNCAAFTNYISEINNTQIDNAKDNETRMLMYNLIGYNDNYSKHLDIFENAMGRNSFDRRWPC